MCGRYVLTKADKLKKRYNLATIPKEIRDNFNAAPGQIMPVVHTGKDGKPKLELMKWGFVPVWAKDPNIGYKLINARDDGIFEKPMWRSAIKKKRCLIPANGFYEWKRPKSAKELKQPFFIHPKQIDLFSFAGVWETWKDAEDKEWNTYSIITTEPNKEMAKVHNRMPVILRPEDEATWIEPSHTDRSDIEPLLRPWENNGLEIYKVSTDVNFTKNNDEHLIYPLNSA